MTGYQSKKAAAQDKMAQPAQEPVAYDKTEMNGFVQDLYDKKMQEGKHGHYETMFHVVHQAIKRATPQPAQEPASVTYKEVQDSMNALEKGDLRQQVIAEEVGKLKLYTAPPQRPWVGLTAEEAAECWTTSATQTWKNFEAKLKEKNNAA